jgi:integrase
MLRVGRTRTKNLRMPKGWRPTPSGIYYRATNAADREIVKAITGGPLCLRLGATHDEAAEAYARLIVSARRRIDSEKSGTISEIVGRARRELLPTITNAKTKVERERHLDELEALFGARRYAKTVYDAGRDPACFRALDVQRYLDAAARPTDGTKPRPIAGNRAVKTWSIAFTWARTRWGLSEYNPATGVMMNQETPRDVLPESKVIGKAFRELDAPMRFCVAMIRYYGRRKSEILSLMLSGVQEDGLHLARGKARGGKAREIVLVWDDRLRKMVARLMRWRDEVKREALPSTQLLLNRDGKPTTVTGFNSAWRRAMKRAGVKGEFTFHDLRAVRASTLTREKATEVLAHDDPRTTSKVYRRGPLVIDLGANKPKPPRIGKSAEGE